MSLPAKYKVAVLKAKTVFALEERDLPKPKEGEALIQVEACGVCGGDHVAYDGVYPGLTFPRVPGHEVVGRVVQVGSDKDGKLKGKRVGVGWHGGHCFQCEQCKEGEYIGCRSSPVTGVHFDGGYGEYMCARTEALVSLPEEGKAEELAPILCAGLTVWNSLQSLHLKPGSTVAVLGIGGLGHLGVQYAVKLGFKTIAVSKTNAKKEDALKMGAHQFIATDEVKNIGEALKGLGGVKCIMSTVPDSKLMSEAVSGLSYNGTLLVLGADHHPITVSPLALIGGKLSIKGWASGGPNENEACIRYSLLAGVKPAVEVFPLEEAEKAYKHMINNKARYRAVIVPRSAI